MAAPFEVASVKDSRNATLLEQLNQNDEKYVKTASVLKLLSNPNRLMILAILADSPKSVNEIHSILTKVSNISQSSLSQHLALLRAHKIVNYQKIGQMSIYHISDQRYVDLLQILKSIDV